VSTDEDEITSGEGFYPQYEEQQNAHEENNPMIRERRHVTRNTAKNGRKPKGKSPDNKKATVISTTGSDLLVYLLHGVFFVVYFT
jgi:hypothetical protein